MNNFTFTACIHVVCAKKAESRSRLNVPSHTTQHIHTYVGAAPLHTHTTSEVQYETEGGVVTQEGGDGVDVEASHDIMSLPVKDVEGGGASGH